MTVLEASHYAAARERLGLPPLIRASHDQFVEATTCTGCRAYMRDGIRIVETVRGCPAHTTAVTR